MGETGSDTNAFIIIFLLIIIGIICFVVAFKKAWKKGKDVFFENWRELDEKHEIKKKRR